MTWRLTPRPLVPVLVQAAALCVAPIGCGDDGGGETAGSAATTDTFPTAGPCAHDPDGAECGSTGATATDSTTAGTDTTTTASTTDTFPTAGPCAHDPNAPGCESTGGDPSTGGSTGGDTDGTGGTAGTGSTGS